MIGWYCKTVTYTTNNISSFTVLDKQVGLSIIKLLHTEKFVDNSLNSNELLSSKIDEYFGEDQNSIWTPILYTKTDGITWLRNRLPSIDLGYPLLNKFISENPDNNSVGIYCEKLKLFFNPKYGTWYRISDTGSFIKIQDYGFSLVRSGARFLVSQYDYNDPEFFSNIYMCSIKPRDSTTDKNRVAIYPIDFNVSTIFWQGTETPQPDFTIVTPPNPYEPGGSSGEGGGNGSFDNGSDTITIPSLPTISSTDTGFTRIYNPTLAQVKDLARYLWTGESVIETIWNHIKQYFESPMEAIIGFNLVPVTVPNGGTTTFKLMYIDTGVSMTVAANQFVDVDCGTLELKEYYGSALDYSPFTKISCFLPYIGNISLNVDEVMGRTLGVKYRVDICSGACVAYITVDGNAIYQYSGHCAIPIPISAADFSNYVSATISTAKLAAAGITAGVGVAAGMMAEDPSPQTNQIVKVTKQVQTARNPATGRQITTGTTTTTVEKPTEQDNTNASFAGLAPQNIANTVGTIMGSKPHIEHSGSFSGNSGYLGVRRPFVIIQRPNMCMPSNYQQLNGFPSMITMALSDCKGFTRVQQVQLTGFQATNPEQAEIMQLLKTGVIL